MSKLRLHVLHVHGLLVTAFFTLCQLEGALSIYDFYRRWFNEMYF
jgi:hypothetical protein